MVSVDGTRAVDVNRASFDRFDADPQEIYGHWGEFVSWAREFDLDAAVPFSASEPHERIVSHPGN